MEHHLSRGKKTAPEAALPMKDGQPKPPLHEDLAHLSSHQRYLNPHAARLGYATRSIKDPLNGLSIRRRIG